MRYSLRHCLNREYPSYTLFECPGETNYLLTRKCSSEYYSWKGPCCKVDEMINFLGNENPQLFKRMKYLMLADDDTFFRPFQLMKWLAAIENSGVGHFPLVGNSHWTVVPPNRGIWHIEGCKEIQASGWMQPLMFTHAAIERMRLASASHGLMDTCRHFDLSQDVGLEVYAWFFGLYHIWMPNVRINARKLGSDIFQPNQLAVHGIKHDKDRCSQEYEEYWPEKDRYNQQMVIGCGNIDQRGPFHNPKRQADTYDAWEYFRDYGRDLEFGKERKFEYVRVNVTLFKVAGSEHKTKVKEILSNDASIEADGTYFGDKVHQRVIPTLQYIGGYSETKHGRENDIVTGKWKEFTLNDCDPPGKVKIVR
jgi:hypothetical protein